jgi:chromosome partitioning protein
MLVQASSEQPASAHVVVLGNEKGGVGKSTLAMHLAVALMNFGQRVATIDLDLRQRTLTQYIENRRVWAKQAARDLAIPAHFLVPRGTAQKPEDNETIEFTGFVDALAAVENRHDFIVVDTAGSDNHMTRLAHSMAETLITPLNDSFVDLAVLGSIDPTSYRISGESHYAKLVREARQQRRLVDGGQTDWVVVRNRLTPLESPNKQRFIQCLSELAARLGFRNTDALAERAIYREFFPRGLTALDHLDENTLASCTSLSHLPARHEFMCLFQSLKLPLDERGQQRAAAHAEWLAARDRPLELDDVLAE